MKKKVYLFDFDKTLTDKDSIFLLWKYAFKINKISRIEFVFKMVLGVLKYIFKGMDFREIKNVMTSVLACFSDNELKIFVKYIYEHHTLKDGVDFVERIDKDAYKMLVSASPINYLKYLDSYFDFDIIMGTNLDNNFKLVGKNNKSVEKVRRIKEHLKEKNIEIDYENSFAFSDSYKNDKPMLKMVKNRYLINSKVREDGFCNLEWE